MSGQTTVIKSQKTELNQTIEELESALRAKEEVRGEREASVYGDVFYLISIFIFLSLPPGVRETQSGSGECQRVPVSERLPHTETTGEYCTYFSKSINTTV